MVKGKDFEMESAGAPGKLKHECVKADNLPAWSQSQRDVTTKEWWEQYNIPGFEDEEATRQGMHFKSSLNIFQRFL